MAKHHVEHHHAKGGHVEIHHHKKGGGVKRAKGGRARTAPENVASGDKVVIAEAEGKEPYAKRGGRIKRRDGGMVQMTGGNVRPRLDRPGRKSGGRVGSDRSPLTSAHNVHASETLPKEDGGESHD
jgi:hypothetical protein